MVITMLKTKLIAGLSVVTLLSTAGAAIAANGTYAGISVGYLHNDTKLKIDNVPAGQTFLYANKAKKRDTAVAGAHFGWERVCPNHLFTAAEVGLDFTSFSKRVNFIVNNAPAASYKYEKGFSMDVALKTGYSFGTFIPYVRLGLSGANWEQKLAVPNAAAPFAKGNYKKSKFVFGFAPGAGVQTKFGRWTTGVEYKFIAHSRHTLNTGGLTFKIKPRTHDVRARLSYGF
jgi:opacity protein-like surface antigen